MKKRGAIDQIFVYIFALIVAALIIGFGYYIITNVLKLGKEVETIKFKQDLEKNINLYYDFAPGTSANVQIRVPDGIKAVCFIVDGEPSGIEYKDVEKIASILKDKNVFFATTKSDVKAEPIYITKFKPSPDPLCINTLRGVLDVDMVTGAKEVIISEHT